MLTIGIDLASQAKDTAICVIRWRRKGARVERLTDNVGDSELQRALKRNAIVAIDVPLGWPSAFVQSVSRWSTHRAWRATSDGGHRLRATDRWVRDHLRQEVDGSDWEPVRLVPLSVSSDRIAMPAMRAASVLTKAGLHGMPRDGSDKVIEVYPAAALAMWGAASRGYKRPEGRAGRKKIVQRLVRKIGDGLVIASEVQDCLLENDHCLDAWIAALIARAHQTEHTMKVPGRHANVAQREGWIVLPQREALAQLIE